VKHILPTAILTTASMLLLTACGGGGGSSSSTNSSSTTGTTTSLPNAEGIGIVVCSGTDQGFQDATVLEAGKVIKGLSDNPIIRLWHLSDGTRKACVTSGSVEVL